MKNKKNNNFNTKPEITDLMRKVFKNAKTVGLTKKEKREGAEALKAFMKKVAAEANIPSPYVSNKGFIKSTFSYMQIHKLIATFSLLAIITLGTGGTAYAAQNALPGDVLYPIKTNFNEPIELFLATSPESKVRVSEKHAATRYKEIETLKSKGELNPLTEEVLIERAILQTKLAKDLNPQKEELPVPVIQNIGSTSPATTTLVIKKKKPLNSKKQPTHISPAIDNPAQTLTPAIVSPVQISETVNNVSNVSQPVTETVQSITQESIESIVIPIIETVIPINTPSPIINMPVVQVPVVPVVKEIVGGLL